jgi:PPOX class probable F420-dependent enzyme
MSRTMDEREWRAFISEGTRTGKLGTTRRDGRPHVVPVWFVLDGPDVVFTTGATSVKGRTLRRTGRACMCIDDERPPYAYVSLEGSVALSEDLEAMLPLAIRIGERYMGADRAEEFGRRNAVAGELLVRLRPEHVIAQADVAA